MTFCYHAGTKGLNYLREHKFKHSFLDTINPLYFCSSTVAVESTSHFFGLPKLHRPLMISLKLIHVFCHDVKNLSRNCFHSKAIEWQWHKHKHNINLYRIHLFQMLKWKINVMQNEKKILCLVLISLFALLYQRTRW